MKKKNLKLGKLNLSKSSIASLGQSERLVGGSGVGPGCNSDIECTNSCNCPPPNPNPDPPSGSQFPACQATDGYTCGGACDATNNSNGAFGCINDIFGGLR